MRRLIGEWKEEASSKPGMLTRISAGAMALQWTGNMDTAVTSFKAGTLVTPEASHVKSAEIDGSLAEMAKITVEEGFENGNRRLKIVDASGNVVQRERKEQPAGGVAPS